MKDLDLTEKLKAMTLAGEEITKLIQDSDLPPEIKALTIFGMADCLGRMSSIFVAAELIDMEKYMEWLEQKESEAMRSAML